LVKLMERMRPMLASAGLLGILLAACSPQTAAPAQPVAPAAGAAVVAPSATPNPRADWPQAFTLGLFGGDDSAATLATNEPAADYLSKKLGVSVKLFTGTSYNAVIEAMRAKRVDAMSVGPFSYLLAVQEAGAEALAIGVSTTKEPAVYDETIRPAYFS